MELGQGAGYGVELIVRELGVDVAIGALGQLFFAIGCLADDNFEDEFGGVVFAFCHLDYFLSIWDGSFSRSGSLPLSLLYMTRKEKKQPFGCKKIYNFLLSIGRSNFCYGVGIFANLTVELIFNRKNQQSREEHEGSHDVVPEVEATGGGFDPCHHVGAHPAADIAAAVDEGDRCGCSRSRKESRRKGPPYAHGSMDTDSREADEEEGHAEAARVGRAGQTDSADEEGASYMPDFIPRTRGGIADDDLHNESCRHRDGNSTAQERSGKAREFFEHRRHPEIEAPEANDPEEVNEAKFEDFRIFEGFEDRVFLAALHSGLLGFVVFREVFFLSRREPVNLVWTVFDTEKEEYGKSQGRNGLEDEEFLPAMHAKERSL